ncbi:MAG TPA: RHS repeat domain-containing protein [Terriglobales bacterium]|nr:RHS repeat domain-containing protein [Terriglobales bacterium]
MKIVLAILEMVGLVYGQDSNPAAPGPRYDEVGHLVRYVYPDGKIDSYGYDSSWRMNRYIDPAGRVTTFTYNADGSMTVVSPDRSAH